VIRLHLSFAEYHRPATRLADARNHQRDLLCDAVWLLVAPAAADSLLGRLAAMKPDPRGKDEVTVQRPSQRDYVGSALLMLVSGVFAYIVLGQIGATLVCGGCVGASLIIAKNL
jgi:hypothetical protein